MTIAPRFARPVGSLSRFVSFGLACALAFVATACSRPAPDATPEGALRLWLDRMDESADDRGAAREAFALLGPDAHKNLEERAVRASRVLGRQVEPEEMLAEGRFGLRFRPETMTANVKGTEAIVDVQGGSSETERASVRCVRTANGWRVEPALPELQALPHREDGGL